MRHPPREYHQFVIASSIEAVVRDLDARIDQPIEVLVRDDAGEKWTDVKVGIQIENNGWSLRLTYKEAEKCTVLPRATTGELKQHVSLRKKGQSDQTNVDVFYVEVFTQR